MDRRNQAEFGYRHKQRDQCARAAAPQIRSHTGRGRGAALPKACADSRRVLRPVIFGPQQPSHFRTTSLSVQMAAFMHLLSSGTLASLTSIQYSSGVIPEGNSGQARQVQNVANGMGGTMPSTGWGCNAKSCHGRLATAWVLDDKNEMPIYAHVILPQSVAVTKYERLGASRQD
eukprot:364640-Chlamydomonas_euryale.AAC.19